MTFDTVTVRPAQAGDDITKIARYIHLTDPYIYPTVTESAEDPSWISLVAACFSDEKNIYFRDRIWVAEKNNAEIVGVLCAIECGDGDLTFSANKPIPPTLREGVLRVEEGYYRPLIAESRDFEGYNIVNLCTEPETRGSGVGTKLLTAFLNRVAGETVHLDVIQNNVHAIHLYEKLGFRITSSYNGFGKDGVDVPCFHMVRSV